VLLNVAEDDKLVGGTKLSFAVRKPHGARGASRPQRAY